MLTDDNNTRNDLIITAVGDISLGDHPVCVGHGMKASFKKFGVEIFRSIMHEFDNADYVIGNLETIASDKYLKKYWLPSYEMRGTPDSLMTLKSVGFSVLGVANNHAMHHGEEAFFETVDFLEKQGISVIGVDTCNNKTKIKYVEGPGNLKSAIVAFSMRPEERAKGKTPYSLRLDEDALLEEISNIKSSINGSLILSIHWGLEFINLPSPNQRELAHKLIDAGVDIIIGHHAHVLQPIEKYKNKLIFYSLGNFCFDLWPKCTKLSVIIKIRLSKRNPPEFTCIPVVIDDNYRLQTAIEKDRKEIFRLLSEENLQDVFSFNESDYKKIYSQERLKFRHSSYRYFLLNFHRYSLNFLIQSLIRTAIRRVMAK